MLKWLEIKIYQNLKIILIFVEILLLFFFLSNTARASSDGSVGGYCCRFQCCNGTWIAVNCKTYPPASCSGVNMSWWCYYNGGYGNCCTPRTGCSCGSLASSNQGYGSKNVSCSNGCGGSTSSTCYCYACSLTSCPAGTSTSGNYGYYTTYSCTNACGNSRTNSCYCSSQCVPPSCPTGTSNEGTGDLYNTSATSCTNQCGQNRTNYCYYNCSDATCSSLESKVTWTDSECSGESCRTTTKMIDITGASPGCDTEQTKTCYIQNSRPESPYKENNLEVNMNLSGSINSTLNNSTTILDKFVKKIKAQTEQDSVFGFTSNAHTGIDLNNPLTVTAQYSDVDGQEDIQAVYLWWSTSDTKDFITPNRIANPTEGLTGKTQNNENFGFMITRDETGTWENIYIPHIEGETKAWVYAGAISTTDSTNPVTIMGSNGLPMINFSVTDISPSDSNTVVLEVLKEYIWEGTDFEKVANDQYHIWTLANDTVGFLPFDEYDIIVDSGDEFWRDSGNVWNIDLENPQVKDDGSLAIVHLSEEDINISFGVRDNETNLSRVRLDACRTSTDGEEPRDLIVDDGSRLYTLKECSEVNWGGYSPDIPIEDGNDILDVEVTNPGAPEFIIDNISVSLTVGLNQNSNGSITFYLTFLDEAGNWSQDVRIHRLGEWAIVKDGLVYGERGVSSSTRTLIDDDIWTPTVILRQYGFEPMLVDITDKVLLGGVNTTTNLLRFLERYSDNHSFKVARFPGVYLESVYSNLISAYQDKMETSSLNFEEVMINDGEISGDLLSHCNQDSPPEICILKSDKDLNDGNLIIDSNFECNAKGFIISTGNITINPDFINEDPQDACVILANGNIVIENGTDKPSTPVDYDIIQAFLIAGGEIVIEREDELSNLNGLLVEGGMAAFTPITESSAILNKRKISLDYRNNYPALAVKHNSKYGLLSTDLFGTQTSMYQIDIGFKPY